MINNLILETRKFIDSDAYYASMKSIARFYEFNDDQEGMFIAKVNGFLLGNIKEENFLGELMSELEIPQAKAKNIEDRVKKEVILPFKQKLITMLGGMPNVDTTTKPKTQDGFPIANDTLRQAPATQQQLPKPRPPESLLKADILAQIENPPRTVIKRYVIEHEPIQDPEHLIQEHYND